MNNESYLNECLDSNLIVNATHDKITSIYVSPGQSSEEFQSFLKKFEMLFGNISNGNPFVSITVSNFNEKSKIWCSSDKTTYEDKKGKSLTSQCGSK